MIRPGETFVWGQDPDTARALLAACDDLGLDGSIVVRTGNGGFYAPDEVADAADLNQSAPATGNEF